MENLKNQNSYLKQQDLLEHAKNPQNYGLSAMYNFVSGEHNPSCGDSITICGTLSNDNFLQDVRFEGKGCMLSLAMASKFTEFVKGKLFQDVFAMDQEIVFDLLGIELGPNRIQCGMLVVAALKAGLSNYQKSKNNK